jgi:hypothetical protein
VGPNEVLDKSIVAVRPTPLFHVVELTDVEEGGVVEAAGAAWIGVAQEGVDELDVARNRPLRVRVEGISACVAAGEIALNAKVYATNDGRVSTTTGASFWQVGIARTPAATAGDHLSVQLTPGVGG